MNLLMVKDLGKIESLLKTKGVDTVGVFQDESLIKEVAHKEAGDKENVKSRSNEPAMLAVEVVSFFF
ncbi:hypothetical protein HanXRQr2_Chr12g0548251 [Helianthus annuus]|uniref:Uncharacterized protein n=1 Tax=Helianthus annuus TaxID=4232 RepID=A0A9K3HHK8_HELAN|nr:hypothetical protein HanXRQr2_Chr12g0548251 [Helianthus annuus]KAJ0489897.1 hypothetical protein HanHA300_Chr12g0449201 [Helianthus annuus]KAJ0493924.1 hypothetical protein HanIR_Chr12g0591591 [Helianthus annuus]KAJ0675479.1 hypothetical protein HanLR1_Chr12g0451641 [Helianthus annuus]KAJ0678769.1 hypothetical protein HanOQP8_Chr12g0451651 [Helianthus annuus]